MPWFNSLGGRKFIIASSAIILSFTALMFSKLDGTQFGLIIVACVGLYGYSNVTQKKNTKESEE